MKKNISSVIKSVIKMIFHMWKWYIVPSVILTILYRLGCFPDQWQSFKISSDLQLPLTQVIIPVVFIIGLFFHVVNDRVVADGYRWWRIFGYVAGGVIGCAITLLVREPICCLTFDGWLRGWTYFSVAFFPIFFLFGVLEG